MATLNRKLMFIPENIKEEQLSPKLIKPNTLGEIFSSITV